MATATAPVAAPPHRSEPPPRFRHRPGLDGIRGLAVAAVLCFHSGFGWARGGYLGVSTFFTLSGFLITTLLLTEHARAGSVSLSAFWARRARRLLPAALIGVTVAMALVLAVGDAAEVDRTRGDALSAIAYVANWRFVFRELSYAELFAADAPLQHLWSLAIEEQFYVLLPLVAVVTFRRGNPAARLAVVAGALSIASLAAHLLVTSADRRYYGTDTRALELLVGVLLACAFHAGLVHRVPAAVRQAAGALALALLALLWTSTEQSSTWLHPWGLAANATLSGVVLVAALDHTAGRLLGARPLAALGRISYGLYVYHWPVYLWLDAERTGQDGIALFAIRAAVTVGAALASHHLVEHRIRYPGALRPRRTLGAAAVTMSVVAGGVWVTTAVLRPSPPIDFASASEIADNLAVPTGGSTPVSTTTPPAPGAAPVVTLPSPARISVFGDSTALLLVPGLLKWQEGHPGVIEMVEGRAAVGCSIGRGGVRMHEDIEVPLADSCSFGTVWPEVLQRSAPDVAVVQIGMWDLVDRILAGTEGRTRWGDPAYDSYLQAETLAANDVLAGTVRRVVWILQPTPVRSTREATDTIFERLPEFNRALVRWLADDPRAAFVDLDSWMRATGQLESVALRPDGTHFSEETSSQAAAWMVPAILRAATAGGVIGPDDVPVVEPGP